MRTLGISGSGDALYLAVAEAQTVLDVKPYSFSQPAGLASQQRLPALAREATKLLKSLNVSRVRILDPEPTSRGTYTSVYTRIALETIFALSAANELIDCSRITRQRLRALLSIPRRGPLHSHVSSIVPKVGQHWQNKRAFAALTALAAERDT